MYGFTWMMFNYSLEIVILLLYLLIIISLLCQIPQEKYIYRNQTQNLSYVDKTSPLSDTINVLWCAICLYEVITIFGEI